MNTPTPVKTPIHFVRTHVSAALTCLRRNGDRDAYAHLASAVAEATVAIDRIGDAFSPASLVLTAAQRGATVARDATLRGDASEAVGAARATLMALDAVPVIIEAPAESQEGDGHE